MKVQEIVKEKNSSENLNESITQDFSSNEYEKLLRKHEADIRNFIKVFFF